MLEAPKRDSSDGAAIGSMYTEPVNQSRGPGFVSRPLLVICISLLSRPVSVPPLGAVRQEQVRSWD
jgi:hypothetical protein